MQTTHRGTPPTTDALTHRHAYALSVQPLRLLTGSVAWEPQLSSGAHPWVIPPGYLILVKSTPQKPGN